MDDAGSEVWSQVCRPEWRDSESCGGRGDVALRWWKRWLVVGWFGWLVVVVVVVVVVGGGGGWWWVVGGG